MSIAMTHPPVAIYREEQWFSWWVYAILLAIMSLGTFFGFRNLAGFGEAHGAWWSLKAPLGMLFGLSLPPILVVGVLRMTTVVSPTHLQVWFGLVPTYRHVVAIDAIRRVEVVRYRPIRDCGGWGIRWDRHGGRVLNARGDRGVRITLDDGSLLLVGTQTPEELARVIDAAIRPAA